METILDLIVSQGAMCPQKPALKIRDKYISYAELLQGSSELANHLTMLGVGPETIVGVLLDRSAEMFIAILGIMQAGAAYLPMDPKQPIDRIKNLLDDSKSAFIVTKPAFEMLVADLSAKIIYCNEQSLQTYSEEARVDVTPPKPENLAYVIYTSGSTGKPKGVMIEHRALMTQVQAFQQLYPLVPDDKCLAVASYVFDASVYEFFTSLTNGCTLHVLETLDVIDVVGFVEYNVQNLITSAYLPPSVVKPFSDYVSSKNIKLPFRRLIVGVEPIRQGVIEKIRRQMPNACLLNGYGPTESTVWSTVLVFTQAYENNRITSIGTALPGYKVLIVDENFKQLPQGVKGQIIVGGLAVARGYLYSEDLTNEKFRTGIVDSDPLGRYYLSGDYAMYLEDGNIEFVGRIDNQIKIKGYRVELGEIEYAFENHPLIERAVVIADKDEDRSYTLVAFYTTSSGQPIHELVTYLTTKLLGYMIPDQLVHLQKIPTTITDKIDRRALFSLIPPKLSVQSHIASNNTVDRLSRIYCELLKCAVIDPASSFFELGGDSIKAMILMLRIHQDFGKHIQVKDFYTDSSLNAMVALIDLETKSNAKGYSDFESIGTRQNVFFDLSASQHELYVLHEFYKSKLLHNIVFRIELQGNLNSETLRLALQQIIQTHESFRTGFTTIEALPKQYVVADIQVFLPFYDFANKSSEFIQDFEDGFGRTEIDLTQPPLWKFVLVKRTQQTHNLYFLIHHLLFDGWSAGIFLAELMQKYDSIESKNLLEKSNETIGVIDFAVWQQGQLKSGVWDYELTYWESNLKNLPKPYMLSGFNAQLIDYGKGNRIWWNIPAGYSEKLMSVAKQEGTSLYVVLLSCYFVLLEQLTGHKDHITTTPYANRTQPPFDELIGYLTNMLAIRIRLDEGLTFQDLIRQVNKTCSEAYSHAMFPYGQMVSKLGYSITQGQSPLYQTMFVMQNWQIPLSGANQLKVKHTDIGNHTAKALLTMNVDQKEDFSLDCWLEFPNTVFTRQEIGRIINAFNQIVESLVEEPQKIIKQISFNENIRKTKSTVLIGEGAVLKQCAERLIERNWSLIALYSNDQGLRTWAFDNKIDFIDTANSLETLLRTKQVDVVFSVNNDWIISPELINSSESIFVNYHNSLLPKFAGLFASNWCIFSREQQHGVSWHLVNENIDAGDVLESMACDVDSAESAFTLNLKCVELASQSFEHLLHKIEQSNLQPIKQDLSQRTYFGRSMRPNRFCELLFDADAESVYSLCKSTEYGDDIYNDFGLPRLIVDKTLYLVPFAEVLSQQSDSLEGQIREMDSNGLSVSTKTKVIRIPKILNSIGLPVDLSEFARKHGLYPGYRFTPYDQIVDAKNLSSLFKNEGFWVSELLNYKPLDTVGLSNNLRVEKNNEFFAHSIRIDKIASHFLPQHHLVKRLNETLLASIGLFFTRLFDIDEVSFPVCFTQPRNCLSSPFVPVTFQFHPNDSVLSQIENAVDLLETYKQKGSYFIDLTARHPELKKLEASKHFYASSVAVTCSLEVPKHSCFNSIGLEIHLDFANNQLLFHSCFEQGLLSASFLAVHFEGFLSQIATFNKKVNELQILLPNEISELVATALTNESTINNANVIELFKQQLNFGPTQPAIVSDDRTYTYQDLENQSNSIAIELLAKQLKPQAIIGILMERSNWIIAAMLGVLKAKSAYLPLDFSYPPNRLKAIIEEAGVAYILCNGRAIATKDLPEQLFLDIQQFDYSTKDLPIPILPAAEAKSPAYVIYTSGSTGQPKGVQISHDSLASFVLSAIDRYQFTKNDRILQFASPTFDAAVEEIYGALCSGACLVVRNETMVSSIQGFVNEVNAKNITVLDLPTAFWKLMTLTMIAEQLRFNDTVRLVIIGGEAADRTTTQNWLSYFGQYPRLINTYGPTETTVVASTCYLDEIELDGEFPIGKPLGSTTTWVTDRFYNLVPQGVEGQLLIGGPQLAMGYLHDKELTSQRFIANKVSGVKNTRLYVTGDKVLLDRKGNLVFRGRVDTQVKLRGFRIDLKEVNAAILTSSQVLDCITAVKVVNNSERLVSYVVLKPNTGFCEAALRDMAKNLLPDYMVPAAFVVLKKLPLTRHMKIDYDSLPMPEFHTDSRVDGEVTTATQEALQKCFMQVLNQSSYNLHESFFHQGGDSLLALSIVAKINQNLGIQLTIGALYQNPTIISLSGFIDEQVAKLQTDTKPNEVRHELVCLKKGKGLPPLVTVYFDAANTYMPALVEEDRAVYTLIPQGSDGERIRFTTIESIAAHYVQLISDALPNQDIVLAGFSFGGLVAIEMAFQMRTNKLSNNRVIVVDTLAPYLWKKVFARKVFIFSRVYIGGIVIKGVCRLLGKPIALKYRNSVILRSWRKAANLYKPNGKAEIVLIKSSNSVSDEPYLGWEEYPQIVTRLRLIEGSHHSIIRDKKKVASIAEWILNET